MPLAAVAVIGARGGFLGFAERPRSRTKASSVQFRMPSSQSVSRTVSSLTRSRPALAIGAGAALASVIGVAAAGAGPTVSLAAAHSPAPVRRAAISPSIHLTDTVLDQQPARPAATASPRVAAAPARQHAQPAGSVASGGSQRAGGSAIAAVPSEQQAQPGSWAASGGSQRAGGSAIAAVPSEQQAQPGSWAASDGSQRAAGSLIAAVPRELPAAPPATSRSAGSAVPATPGAAPARSAPAPAQSAPASPQPAAAPSVPAAAPAPQPAPQPYQIYDSVSPSLIPSSSQAIAVYANGNYAAQPSQLGHRGLVLWIDTNGSDPNADVLDVEPGDATPLQAASWVAQKLDASPNSVAIVYTMKSEWPAVQAAINALPWWMPSHTRYWIADPTGVPHVVPGSQATQWYWGQNYDISTALPGF
jgi:hypothetical protein